MENFLGFYPAFTPKHEGNKAIFSVPARRDSQWPLFSVADVGNIFVEILKNPDKYNGKTINAWSEKMRVSEVIKQYGEAKGVETELNELTDEQFLQTIPGDVGVSILNMFRFFDDYGVKHLDLSGTGQELDSKDVYPNQIKWREFLKQ